MRIGNKIPMFLAMLGVPVASSLGVRDDLVV
jgi:hypothetical protein